MGDLESWEKAAGFYAKLIGEDGDALRLELLNPVIIKLLGDIQNKKILDAGGGEGYLSRLLWRLGPEEIICLDGSKKLIEIARKKDDSGGKIKYQVADLEGKLPFSQDFFDVIIANMVLMDLGHPEAAVAEFSRILKKDGIFIFSILHPVFNLPYSRLKKGIREKVFRKPPSILITDYIHSQKIMRPMRAFGESKFIKMPYYHRPLGFYFDLLGNNKFLVSDFVEPVLSDDFIKKNPKLAYAGKFPWVLVVRAIESGS